MNETHAKSDRIRGPLSVLACALMVATSLLAYAPDASACGGLFCNNTRTPVNQTAERIIFSKNDDGTVTAIVQIMYQGPTDRFAWVLPVPGAPEVDVSSNIALDRLQQATNPVYRLNTRVEGECRTPSAGFILGPSDSTNASRNNGSGFEDPAEDDVNVVDSGTVGPYNHTTISVQPGTAQPEEAAMEWLDTNGYNTSALAPDLLRDYLEDGMNLLAVKLQKSTDSGDIRPIRITYDSELPMIPIKLTAVAANDDMGVMVWVLGQERAIPANYKTLELNQALINWFNPGATYDQIVNQAADEAGGQGFVTELAGPPTGNTEGQPNLASTLFTRNDGSTWNTITQSDWSEREGELLATSAAFASWDGYVQVVDDHVPLSVNVSARDFARCPTCYEVTGFSEIGGFDPQTFIDQLDQRVVRPVRDTEELVTSFPYITRLYTTMSAADMTLDPTFDFNSELGDYSNRHVAERVVECSSRVTRSEAPWSVDLPDGGFVYGTGQQWPFALGDSEMPATRRIVQHETMGDGTVVEDNTGEIDDVVGEHNQSITDEFSGGLRTCSTGSGSPLGLAWLVVGIMGSVAVRKRWS